MAGHERIIDASAAAPLLVGVPPPVESKDRQVRALLGRGYHQHQQWKVPQRETSRATLTRLRDTLDRLLPVLTGARDFAGAAKVLSILYHRFTIAPALCVQTSLEILRRHPEHRDDLLQFYLAAIQDDRLDKRLLLKELWMFYIIQGEFYEAYHLYKDEIQKLDVQEDPRLLANFGILCYWLLFIESSEIREKLKRDEDIEDDGESGEEEEEGLDMEDEEEKGNSEPEDDDDEDGNTVYSQPASRGKKRKRPASRINQWSQSSAMKQSIESLIESRYLFKTSIGVHILYQEATSALRRAASLCPTSAQFAEFYVQLLVLAGQIDTACDYLENFYHLNDSDPYAAKMLAGFLEIHYPDSAKTLIKVYLRWLKNDPMSAFALAKITELASAGSIPVIHLVHAFLEAVDACGGDLYLSQAPSAALALWRQLAAYLVTLISEATSEREAGVIRRELLTIGSKRVWWKRAYFSRPHSSGEVAAILQSSDTDGVRAEAMIYRARVAMSLFGSNNNMVRAVFGVLHEPAASCKQEHVRLFKSCFNLADLTRIKHAPPSALPLSLLRDTPFTHIVRQAEPHADALAEFKGETLATARVMQRSDLIMNANAARQYRVKVVNENVLRHVDEELVAALEQAVRDDKLTREIEEEYHGAKQRGGSASTALGEPQRTTAKPKKYEIALPMYVYLVEEATFKDRQAPINHIYTHVVETLTNTSLEDVIVPTLMEIETAHRLFLRRWARNEFVYGHRGLLHRYETFLAKFVQPHVHAAIRAGRLFSVTGAIVADAMQQMKRRVVASDVHFPTPHEVEVVLHIKAGVVLRMRRKLLRFFRHSMKVVMKKLEFLETRELASLALEVCKLNGFEGVVSLEDFESIAEPTLLHIYRKQIVRMRVKHRVFVNELLEQAQLLQQPVDLSYLLAQLNEKYPKYVPQPRRLRACMWLKNYERENGPLENVWDRAELLARRKEPSAGQLQQRAVENVNTTTDAITSTDTATDSVRDTDAETSLVTTAIPSAAIAAGDAPSTATPVTT